MSPWWRRREEEEDLRTDLLLARLEGIASRMEELIKDLQVKVEQKEEEVTNGDG